MSELEPRFTNSESINMEFEDEKEMLIPSGESAAFPEKQAEPSDTPPIIAEL